MIKVKAFAFTFYPISDIARARAFYEGLFGLVPSLNYESEGKCWIEYELVDATLAITTFAQAPTPGAGGPTLAFEVEDFDAAIATLRSKKVKFLHDPIDSGVCKMAHISDPDGNPLTIHRRNS